jgi:hypothetical protein
LIISTANAVGVRRVLAEQTVDGRATGAVNAGKLESKPALTVAEDRLAKKFELRASGVSFFRTETAYAGVQPYEASLRHFHSC